MATRHPLIDVAICDKIVLCSFHDPSTKYSADANGKNSFSANYCGSDLGVVQGLGQEVVEARRPRRTGIPGPDEWDRKNGQVSSLRRADARIRKHDARWQRKLSRSRALLASRVVL